MEIPLRSPLLLFSPMLLFFSLAQAQDAGAWKGKNAGLPEAEAFKNAVLSKEAKEVSQWVFTRGSATYTLTGQAAYLKAGGLICGVYFKGQGSFRYTTRNAQEFPVTTFNASRHVKAKLECTTSAITVGEPLQEATFWFAGGSPLEIPGAEGSLATSDFEAQQKFFRTPNNNAFYHQLTLCQLDPARRPYFLAELRGKSQPWMH